MYFELDNDDMESSKRRSLFISLIFILKLMLLNVNTYANSVIESSFALTKFMEVLMNVYFPYSFNC